MFYAELTACTSADFSAWQPHQDAQIAGTPFALLHAGCLSARHRAHLPRPPSIWISGRASEKTMRRESDLHMASQQAVRSSSASRVSALLPGLPRCDPAFLASPRACSRARRSENHEAPAETQEKHGSPGRGTCSGRRP